MKKKSLIILTACLAVALIVAAVGVGFAWYTSSAGADNQLEIEADGYLVIYFDENEYPLEAIKPAVASAGAINNNVTDFDVLNVGGNVVEAATVVQRHGFLHYLNQSDASSANAQIDLSCDVYMVFEDGSKEKLSLQYDMCVAIDLSWVYLDAQNGENPASNAVNIGVDDWWQNPSKTVLNLDGSADISLDVTMYLRQVDDLCSPYIRDAQKIQVVIKAAIPKDDSAD
ncbi:MAG: hypothetical protein NC037_00915 [Bacteroides sp.]|nr:hypothetical protein [Bacillota bacterium]MCM1393763.1 hypothetical protein [[Eubacterium] siraeum]MCM1455080.1 hypothetical protein [Bacteroides sp.]